MSALSESSDTQSGTYQHHLVDESLAPSPYIELDVLEDGEPRLCLRFGDYWAPYERLIVLVSRRLETAQESTSRNPYVPHNEFDARTIGD